MQTATRQKDTEAETRFSRQLARGPAQALEGTLCAHTHPLTRGSPRNTKWSLRYLVRCSGGLELVSQQVNFCWGQTSSSRSSGCESKLARSKSLQNKGKLGEVWERLNHCKFTKWPWLPSVR